MPELRWTLLILGALFIGGLAFWEYRRQRHARGGQGFDKAVDPRFGESADDGLRASHESFGAGATRSDSRDGSRVYREPTLTFPEARHEPRQGIQERDPMAELPVVEIDDKELTGLRVDDDTAVDSFSMSADDDARDDLRDDLHDDVSDAHDLERPAAAAPMVPRLEPAEPMIAERRFTPRTISPEPETRSPAPAPSSNAPAATGASAEGEWDHFAEGVIGSARIVGATTPPATLGDMAGDVDGDVAEESGDAAAADASAAPAAPFNVDTDAFAITEPIVEWPEDDTRKIIALRLVSGGGERFSGRAVRQALAAEGFLLGKFDIFHKPGPDARAVLSAASLTKPGSFSLSNMDSQRFGGLSLFAVLPGPLSPTATFDELLTTARSLNDRLRGALQDERGEPLTPVRSASIRDSLTAQATAAAPVVGPPPAAAPAPESDATPH